jgi:t-SNARE complex subunit (syntaxin)
MWDYLKGIVSVDKEPEPVGDENSATSTFDFKKNWWIWLVLIIIVIIVIYFVMRRHK